MGRPRKYKDEETSKKATTRRMNEWNRENKVAICLRYHKVYDKELIEKLNSVPNKNDYIRQLILKDMQKGE